MRYVLQQKQLEVVFEKVLAHSGIEGNERADRLATAAYDLPPVSLARDRAADLPFELRLRQTAITSDPRRALRQQRHCRRIAHLQETLCGAAIGNWNEIDWDVAIYVVHAGTSPRSRVTSSWHNKMFAFRLKVLTGMLPVRQRLHRMYPEQNLPATCPRCAAQAERMQHVVVPLPEETNEYLWTCPRAANGFARAVDSVQPAVLKVLKKYKHVTADATATAVSVALQAALNQFDLRAVTAQAIVRQAALSLAAGMYEHIWLARNREAAQPADRPARGQEAGSPTRQPRQRRTGVRTPPVVPRNTNKITDGQGTCTKCLTGLRNHSDIRCLLSVAYIGDGMFTRQYHGQERVTMRW
ncbi:hypothetical protein RI367_007649 [Sorochytrium milnesiophthora]